MQSIENTLECHRRCFESIALTVRDNENLRAQIAHLQCKLQKAETEQAALAREKKMLGVQVSCLGHKNEGKQKHLQTMVPCSPSMLTLWSVEMEAELALMREEMARMAKDHKELAKWADKLDADL